MESWSPWLNGGLFAVSSAIIWWAGTRLEHTADDISVRTGLGQAFTGVLLLAAATSLPELAATITAVAILEDPALAVHNLLGGVALQTGILVVADLAKRGKGALTYFSPRFSLLIQGVGLLLLLQLVLGGITARGVPEVFSVSVWLVGLLLAWVALMFLVYRHRGHPRWTASRADDRPQDEAEEEEEAAPEAGKGASAKLWLTFAGFSLVVLVAGFGATQTVDALATQTGLGSAFMGATLLALATSLPELSTCVSAVRNRRYTTAISNVFGSNSFDVTLLVLADAMYRDGSILKDTERTATLVALVGAVMTCLYLWGLLERENRTFLGMGWDSVGALLVYGGGMAVLYSIQ